MKLSIIIVHYRVEKELFDCLTSIRDANIKTSYEVIVVDNDEKKTIEKELKKKFSFVKYIKSPRNIGFGSGNNLGAKCARGEFLFFLNPDTILQKDTVNRLVEFIEKNKNIGIVAPLLLDRNNKPYSLQGTKELNPLNGIIGLSFLNKLFPNNLISKNYWLLDWDKKGVIEVDVVPGTAFIIRRSIFEKIGGFDERFFLYFEESDLCRRIRQLGYKIFIVPHSKVVHFWGRSTVHRTDTNSIFAKSRFKYFRKHYGLLNAFLVELFSRANMFNLFVVGILILASLLRFYKLNELMSFIPDQGWFYLSARDMLLTGIIPLVGPETSHPWIHHGPLWTYTLAIILWVFNFHPVAPSYFTAILGVVTVWLMYKVTSELFSKRVGIIATLLYATSPFIVLNARLPYHTSPIPFFVILLFYSVYKWIKGNVYFFPLITFLMGVLYNHELTTFVLFIPILFIVVHGFWKKKKWAIELLNKKIILYSVFAILIPMIPFILYDIGHGYKQTIGFLVWVGYRLVKFPLNIPINSLVEPFSYLQQLIFAPSIVVTLIIIIFSFSYFMYLVFKGIETYVKNYSSSEVSPKADESRSFSSRPASRQGGQARTINYEMGYVLLFLYLFIPLFGLFLHRAPIEADVLLISPFIIMAIAVFVDRLMNFSLLKKFSILILLFISFINVHFILSTNYLTINTLKNRLTISKQLVAADSIIKKTKGRNYNLVGKGELSFFPVFTMPYEYLLWWKGYPPTKEDAAFKIVVWERDGEIVVYEKK